MPEVTINAARLYYELLGRGEPVALLNGVLMTTQSWTLQTAFLQQRYRCLLHDMRGQLRSEKPEGRYTLAQHVADLDSLLDHLKIASCHVVGTSYGGEVGMLFACEHPERVRTLSVIASASHLEPLLAAQTSLWARLAREHPDALYDAVAAFTFSNGFLSRNPAALQQGADRLKGQPPAFFHAFARLVDAFQELALTDRLGQVRCPTLVICGEDDALKPVRYSRVIAETIPDAELVVVPDAGHAVVIEQADAVNTRLDEFIQKHASSPMPDGAFDSSGP
jgi:3-oxoadipate enol-lactonase